MSDITWISKTVKLADLKPYDKNPRKIDKGALDKLKRSIQEDGYHGRIIANSNLMVAGGHQRLKALKSLGYTDVEVLVPSRELAENEFRRILIRDNLQAGEWDMDALAADFTPEELTDWGFPEELLPKQEGVVNEPAGDEDEAPEAPAVAQTVRGDVYEIGPHRLMCGDSTLIDDVDALMAGAKADMVFTDPPYNIDYQGVTDKRDKIKNDKMADGEFVDFLQRSILPSETMYVCCSWQYAHLFRQAMDNMARKPKAMIIWDKVKPAQHLDKYYKQHEIIWYCGDFGGQKTVRGDVWELKRQKNTVHPTMKPVELIEIALGDQNDKKLVYDGFGGSGSTMVAAHKLGRTAYLMELDEKYCDVIVQRMHKLFPDLPVKRNGEIFAVEIAERGKA